MAILVTCKCGKRLRAKDEHAGKRALCRHCGETLVIPGGGSSTHAPQTSPLTVPRHRSHTPPLKQGKAIASLVVAILSLLLFCLVPLSLPLAMTALVLGFLARHEIKTGVAAGKGMATAGIVLGFVTIGLGVLIVGLAVQVGDSGFEEWVGTPAPDLLLTTVDGQVINLSDLRGRRVVLDFFATWCPPCREQIPHLVRLTSEFPEDELQIIGISSEDAETLGAFVATAEINYPISQVTGGLLPPFSEVTAVPTSFFLDRSGRIQYVLVGYEGYESLRAHCVAEDL